MNVQIFSSSLVQKFKTFSSFMPSLLRFNFGLKKGRLKNFYNIASGFVRIPLNRQELFQNSCSIDSNDGTLFKNTELST